MHFLNGEITDTCNKLHNLVILNGLFHYKKKRLVLFVLKKFTEVQSKDIKTKEKKILEQHKENKEASFKYFVLTVLDFPAASATPCFLKRRCLLRLRRVFRAASARAGAYRKERECGHHITTQDAK